MLILQIAAGILLAGFLYRYWRRVGLVLIAAIALVIVVAFWQQVLGLMVLVPLLFLLVSGVGPDDWITNSKRYWRSYRSSTVYRKDSRKM